jgi:glutathione peroxidase
MKNTTIARIFFSLLIASGFAGICAEAASSFYDFKVNTLAGVPVDLSSYKGKVLLVVNTASKCGYTPQYQGLQTLYQRYQSKGFEVLAFPSNDFGGQEPGNAKEIKTFCETKYKVNFPLFEKNPFSGSMKQPLYDWLVKNEPGNIRGPSDVSWNYEKFLISKEGKVLARYRSSVTPESPDVVKAIEGALK